LANSPSNTTSSPLQRYLFWPLWFLVVPIGLAALAVQFIGGGEEHASSLLGQLQWFVKDQRVPAAIVFFTIFEMVLYHYRHSLPFAGELSVAGRSDIPRELRRTFESALHLIDDAERILTRNPNRIQRELPSSKQEDIRQALDNLRATLDSRPFDAEAFTKALAEAAHQVEENLARWQKSELREYAESIGVAIGVALLLRAFVVEAFKIPSGSMLPTLQIQDHIFVNKLVYGPSVPFTKTRFLSSMPPGRGDVMVFEFPEQDPIADRQDFIKRVIATEGDVLELEGGHPIINGWPVPSCHIGTYEFHAGSASTERGELYMEHLGKYSYLTIHEEGRFDGRQGPYHVAPGEVWVLGDNRNNSMDSRAWNGGRGGGVPYGNIKGRAMFVWLAFGFDSSFHWKRIFHNVLGKPTLPPGAPPQITAKLEECLKNRPANTIPPPPSARVPSAEPTADPAKIPEPHSPGH